jgi:hypothetical protein
VGNLETAWDDRGAFQDDFSTAGCFEFGTASGGAYDGGQGITWNEKLCDAGGFLEVWNDSKSVAAGLKAGYLGLAPTTASGLATVDPSPTDGDRAYVTNATACTFGSAVTGGGSAHCPVYYDGSSSSWKAG